MTDEITTESPESAAFPTDEASLPQEEPGPSESPEAKTPGNENPPRSVRQLFHDVRGHLSVCVSGARILRRKLARGLSEHTAQEIDEILEQMELNLRAGLDDLSTLHDRNK